MILDWRPEIVMEGEDWGSVSNPLEVLTWRVNSSVALSMCSKQSLVWRLEPRNKSFTSRLSHSVLLYRILSHCPDLLNTPQAW